ncbi:hypothetical protein V1525DRAFT_435515 [Lipomyces kononenkoae]|uniref:Uncharacterized protein n=1 Tax=Lipomyces kononenkoae TaxID=34357 RepID=A0ACC3SSB0_LIPKO
MWWCGYDFCGMMVLLLGLVLMHHTSDNYATSWARRVGGWKRRTRSYSDKLQAWRRKLPR